MAILWHEMWHEALEEASRLYFGESNVEGMLATLMPLHEMMESQGPTTLKEISFVQALPWRPPITTSPQCMHNVSTLRCTPAIKFFAYTASARISLLLSSSALPSFSWNNWKG